METDRRAVRTIVWTVDSTRERVFPLLCPIREREWIPGWTAETVASRSGVAEDGAVFTTPDPATGGRHVWVVSRYLPPDRVEYVVFRPRETTRLSLALADDGPGRTRVEVHLEATALDDDAARDLERSADAHARSLASREAELRHFLRTGALLSPAAVR